MEPISVNITILKPLTLVWNYFYSPKHIVKWNFPTPNWRCAKAEIDLKEGGKFNYSLKLKDKTFGYDFAGVIEEIKDLEYVRSRLNDGRKVEVYFKKVDDNTTEIKEIFEPEEQYSREMQRAGLYAILDRFHKYAEHH